MENQIDKEVSKARIMELIELVNSLTREHSSKYVGKTVEILPEDYYKKKGMYLGRNEYGAMAYFKSEKDVIGEFTKVKILEANGISLSGEIAED